MFTANTQAPDSNSSCTSTWLPMPSMNRNGCHRAHCEVAHSVPSVTATNDPLEKLSAKSTVIVFLAFFPRHTSTEASSPSPMASPGTVCENTTSTSTSSSPSAPCPPASIHTHALLLLDAEWPPASSSSLASTSSTLCRYNVPREHWAMAHLWFPQILLGP
ncbi:hypothetical protein Pelo_18304 [Pelomyxa schiedti]|nr:hypothetical protein Pelo_18304 [Pelomyxa schiedti]